MSEAPEGTGEWSCEVTEPPVTLRRRTNERSGGQVLRYRLETAGDERTVVRFRQAVPESPAVADVGFRLDAAPEEWTAEESTVEARATAGPDDPVELVLGLTFEGDTVVGSDPPEPVVESVESAETDPERSRPNRTWDRPPSGADPEAIEDAIASVEATTRGEGPGRTASTGFRLDPGASTDEPAADPSPDDRAADTPFAGGAEDGESDEVATREALREAVAERNEELMRLQAELAAARRERADLRETVRGLRETVDALVDQAAVDAPEDGLAPMPGDDAAPTTNGDAEEPTGDGGERDAT